MIGPSRVVRASIGCALVALALAGGSSGTAIAGGFGLGLDQVVPEPTLFPVDQADTVGPEVELLGEQWEPAPGLPRQVGSGVVALAVAPLAWERADWRRLGLGLLAVGAASLFDDEIDRFADAHRGSGLVRVADAVRPLGNEGGVIALGALYLVGRRLDRPRLTAVAGDGLEAVLLSAGVLVPILKQATGRRRPRETSDSGRFGAGGGSFPSGEAAEAFAIAGVVSAHTERRWVRGLAWGFASLVAAERIALDGHWASDVVAGALLGASVGRWVVRRNRPELERSHDLAIMPTVEQESWGVVATLRF